MRIRIGQTISVRAALFSVAAITFAAVSAPALAEDAAGKWTGKISAGGAELPIIVVVDKVGGALTGHLESPSQTTQPIPIEAITSDGKSFSFTSLAVLGSYEAKWDEAKKAWLGKWSQNGAELDLDLSRAK